MKNVRILDCTLRDGGRIINCAFPDTEIAEITERLSNAKIDIIEVGFLRDWRNVSYIGDSTFFTDVDQIRPFIPRQRNDHTMYVAFIDYGMFDFNSLKPYDGTSIDGIRYGFTKKNFVENKDDVIKCVKTIKEKGYKLFIQGVNSLNYSDREILELVDMVNEIHPYSFGIVDTYGAMYIDDVDRIYGLIDHNMDSDICINFHSHNNYQLSFAFAQEVIKLSRGIRHIIIDSTLAGVGKVAGNLCTELIVNYMTRKLHYDYEMNDILDIIDDYIQKYNKDYHWGYSIPAMMAGIYKSHPNNVIYLTEKFRLETKDIGNLLSMIDPTTRQRYDYDNIERLYQEYISDKVDDYKTIQQLKTDIGDRDVLVLAPGQTLIKYKDRINEYISKNNPVVISVNFVSEISEAYAFYGNSKRYKNDLYKREGHRVIISSNIHGDNKFDFVANYYSLINRGFKYFENSSIMLLNLLKRVSPLHIAIAGMDGFKINNPNNYFDNSFQKDHHNRDFDLLNEEMTQMITYIRETMKDSCEIQFITPSEYLGSQENLLLTFE